MGDNCSPENMAKTIIPATESVSGRLDHEKYQRMAKAWEDNPFDYIDFLKTQQYLLKNINVDISKKISAVENGRVKPSELKQVLQEVARFTEGRIILAPREALGKQFMEDISGALRKLDSKYKIGTAEYKSAYNQTVVPLARKRLNSLARAATRIEGNDTYAKFLKSAYGLNPEQVGPAMDYLQWLTEGGAHKATHKTVSFKELIKGIKDRNAFESFKLFSNNMITNISKANARSNLTYLMYQGADMPRIAAGIIADPRVKNPLQGAAVVLKSAAKGMVDGGFLGKVPERLKNIEGSGIERDIKGAPAWDLFGRSVYAQRVMAYEADKALGGDGLGFMSSHVFDYHPYEAPEMLRDLGDGGRVMLRLGRFMLAESARAVRLFRNVYSGSEMTRKQAATEIAVEAGLKTMLFGAPSVIPTFVDDAIGNILGNEEWKEYKKEFGIENPLMGKGAIGNALQGAADALFGEGMVELKTQESVRTDIAVKWDYLGNYTRMMSGVTDSAFQGPFKATGKLLKGDVIGFLGQTAIFASAIGNLSGVIPTQVTKLFRAIAENYDAENPKKFATEMTKAVIGYNSAKQADETSSRRNQVRYVARRKPGT